MTLSDVELEALDTHHNVIGKLHRHLHEVGRFPHEGQYPPIRAVFNDKKRVVMCQYGRSGGKTESILYIAERFSVTRPGKLTYIVCPELKQARKIYWIPKRLQNYGPREFLATDETAIRETETRKTYYNESTVIVDGCENYESLRGIKPDLVIYDEFQHHSPYFDEEVMQPNLSSGHVTLVVMGTPPRRHCYYAEFKKRHLAAIEEGDPDRAYFEFPSSVNPTLDKGWLQRKKAELMRANRHQVWLREYEGKDAFDQEGAVFPMWNRLKHVFPHQYVVKHFTGDISKLKFFAMFDPGTCSCFAVLFMAWNPYSGDVFLIDEIYEKDRAKSSATAIWQRANAIKSLYLPALDRWTNIYDEAAAWFQAEIYSAFGEGADILLIPTQKLKRRAETDETRAGESVLMDLMMREEHGLQVSDKCEKFIWEMEQFVRDDRGRYPKGYDHLMDCLYYWATESGFRIKELKDYKYQHWAEAMENRRALSFEDYVVKRNTENNLFVAAENSTDVWDWDDAWN